MSHFPLRFIAGGLLFALLLGASRPAPGQDKDKAGIPIKGDPRRIFKAPETAPEFWRALRFEIEIGKFDIAAEYLRGFLGKNPTEEELLQIEAKEGMHTFLQLLTIPRWSADPKADLEAKKNAQELVNRVNAVVRKQLGDPKRIAKFIQNLRATEEERIFAIGELRRSGPLAVPALVAELLRTVKEPDDHQDVLSALPYLSADAFPALAAALDVSDATIRGELIDLFVEKAETRAVPHLWYLSAASDQPETIRNKATAALRRFLPRQSGRLPDAHAALTDVARQYLHHKVKFADPQAVPVWRWDGKQLAAEVVPASKAEEYFGLRFARQALALKPDYQPAQEAFLTLAIEKGFERAGLDQPLSKGAPEVKELLGSASAELLLTVLEQALAEQRVPVILGVVRALGDRAEAAALRSAGRGTPALLRALYFPDRRVQLAAADAVLRIPNSPAPVVSTRVVEILARAVAGEQGASAKPKVLIAFAHETDAHAVSRAAAAAGLDPVRAHTGREAMARLQHAADIDLLLVEASLPNPGYEALLGQLRSDANVGRLPLLLVAPTGREATLRDLSEHVDREARLLHETKTRERFAGEKQQREANLKRLQALYAREAERLRDAYQRSADAYPNVWVTGENLVRDGERLKSEVQERMKESKSLPLSEAERKGQAAEAIVWLARLARKEVPGYDIQPAVGAILQALQSAELAPFALEAAGKLSGPKAQRELALFLLDGKRPAELRAKAAEELVGHLQHQGAALLPAQVDGLKNLVGAAEEPKIRAAVAQVLGSLRPSATETGQRLQQYTPPLTPAQPSKPKEPAEKAM